MPVKGAYAFRTISEAAEEIGVAQHVLRFWETKFAFVRPMKRAGGRRFYRPADIAILAAVRRLLHQEGYTIKGVQLLHREQGLKSLVQGEASPSNEVVPAATRRTTRRPTPSAVAGDRAALEEALRELEAAKARLDSLLPQA